MDIYQRKSRIKIFLIIAALLIAIGSLWYTNQLAGKIAHEEENKVRLWAQALEKRAKLVKLTGNLFEKIAADQRQDIENWAEATSLIIKTEDMESITFLSKIIIGNTNIPVIHTTADRKIIDYRNIDLPADIDTTVYLDSIFLSSNFQNYPPVEINYISGENFIYYSDSKIFSELKQTLKDLIESFISEIVVNSASLPVVLVDENGHVIASGNIDEELLSPIILAQTLAEMQTENTPIQLDLGDESKRIVYYKNSIILKQLKAFPFVQLFLFSILMLVAYVGFSSARNAEQNRVWVGLAKETAHQLGTPISSLSAWIDYMKEMPTDESNNNAAFIKEVEKDVNRLTLIAERFSKIGSKADLEVRKVRLAIESAVHYMEKRSSDKVKFTIEIEEEDTEFAINEALFNWVIENLIKNALDAMEGVGAIKVRVFKSTKNIVIDVIDSGKGIQKSKFETVFEPGFSTKKRGWGLGLSLVRRIVENYHEGEIYIKESGPEGTTFRMKLPLV
jgi:two-component system, sporulation sensor kinase D